MEGFLEDEALQDKYLNKNKVCYIHGNLVFKALS